MTRRGQRGPDLDRQALPREFIDQREDPKRLSVRVMILEEVIGPDVIGALGSDGHGVPSAATPPAAATRPGQAQAQLLPQRWTRLRLMVHPLRRSTAQARR